MAADVGTLRHKGGRYETRGWNGAGYVKRATAKRARRLARRAVRDNESDVIASATKGWSW